MSVGCAPASKCSRRDLEINLSTRFDHESSTDLTSILNSDALLRRAFVVATILVSLQLLPVGLAIKGWCSLGSSTTVVAYKAYDLGASRFSLRKVCTVFFAGILPTGNTKRISNGTGYTVKPELQERTVKATAVVSDGIHRLAMTKDGTDNDTCVTGSVARVVYVRG